MLYIDDDRDDYELTSCQLQQLDDLSITLEWAPSFEEGIAALDNREYILVLVDYDLGDRTGLELLDAIRLRKITTPIIMLTGCGNRDIDLAAMHAGADAYLEKDQISQVVLERSIRYALQRVQVTREREELIAELEATLDEVTVPQEPIPICAACRKVRDTNGLWQQVEDHLGGRGGITFSHVICPYCASELYTRLIDQR